MTEMPDIATTSPAATPSRGDLDVLCAEPLLRAPLVDRLRQDGHTVRLHEGDGAPDRHWQPSSGVAVVVFPSSTIEAVRHGWMSFVKHTIDHLTMVLVACAANVSAPLLAAGGQQGGRDVGGAGHQDHREVVDRVLDEGHPPVAHRFDGR